MLWVVLKISTRSVAWSPTCQPTLPPLIETNCGGCQVPVWSRISSTPRPCRTPTMNPPLSRSGTMATPWAWASSESGIPRPGMAITSSKTTDDAFTTSDS